MERKTDLYHFRIRLMKWKSEFLKQENHTVLKVLCTLEKEFRQAIRGEIQELEFKKNSPDIYLQMQRKKFKKILNFKDYEQKN